MSIKALADYTQYSRYARYNKEKKRRETWHEQVDRVFEMHERKFGSKLDAIRDDFEFAKEMVKKKRVLGSQRALQFGGDPILQKPAKLYNCTVSYVDRPRFFQECMYLLLCGCGTGFSVQKHHIAKLPKISPRTKGKKTFIIADTIEGWADAIGVLLDSYFETDTKYFVYDLQSEQEYSGYEIEFDFSLIRPKGAPISWGGKAPGPDGLKNSIEKITTLLDKVTSERGTTNLKPIEAYDVVMHSSDAVLSGGIRRSATICLFSKDDEEMITAKTGSWFIDNPQRGRSNNSALLVRSETTKEEFANLMKSVKEFGEPGFVWADDKELLVNPCVEIGMRAYTEDGRSGWQFCNLCEINGRKATSEEAFLEQCRAAAIIGTLQAAYDEFNYLTKETSEIVKREALLGVSMTGMMDNPDITFNQDIQKKGAQLILDINERISQIIGINKCARATCVKPAGSTSCILGSASGIHPHHAKRYMRRVQANKLEFPVQHFMKINPTAVQESVWSNNKTDLVITFLCEVPDGAKTKNQIDALKLLEHVKLTQQNWVEAGTRHDACVAPWLRHNVSNTINVKDHEWDDVEKFIYDNRQFFAGISLLSHSGDMDYPQAPFASILNERELVQTYGEGTVFASGLVVDGLYAFDNNLWAACDCALGVGEDLSKTYYEKFLIKHPDEAVHKALELPGDISFNEALGEEFWNLGKPEEPLMPHKNGYSDKQWALKLADYSAKLTSHYEEKEAWDKLQAKVDWVRRFKQFADRYCEGNLRRCNHMLKHVSLWKEWLDLKRDYKEVDWSQVEEEWFELDVSSISGDACSGPNGCDAGDLGAKINAKKQETKIIAKAG